MQHSHPHKFNQIKLNSHRHYTVYSEQRQYHLRSKQHWLTYKPHLKHTHTHTQQKKSHAKYFILFSLTFCSLKSSCFHLLFSLASCAILHSWGEMYYFCNKQMMSVCTVLTCTYNKYCWGGKGCWRQSQGLNGNVETLKAYHISLNTVYVAHSLFFSSTVQIYVGARKSERERPNFKYGHSQLIRSRKQVSHGTYMYMYVYM